MAAPTVPTTSTILTEAFKRSGVPSPTPALIQRATDEWLQEVLTDIQADKRWHAIEETMVLIPQAYVQVIPIPSPISRVLRMRFYGGNDSGTAASGGSASITVPSGRGNDAALGRKVFITAGTGAAQVNRIIGRSGDVYSVSCDWTTQPDGTSVYLIASMEHEMHGPDVGIPLTGLGPTNVLTHWEEWENKLRIYPVPNTSTIAIEIDGLVDLNLVDVDDARYTRIRREWRNAIMQGLRIRIFEDQDDERNQLLTEKKYQDAKTRLMVQDSRQRRGLKPPAMRSPGGLPRRRV